MHLASSWITPAAPAKRDNGAVRRGARSQRLGSVLGGNGAHELFRRMAMAKAMAKVSGIERQRDGM